MTEINVDLDSIIQGLSELGAQLQNSDNAGKLNGTTPSDMTRKPSCTKGSCERKKTRHNVSFSDKPPVFYESQPQSDEEYEDAEENKTENIYEGIDNYTLLNDDGSLTLATLLESRKSQITLEEQALEMSRKSARLDKELENVLRELDVLTEECETADENEDNQSLDELDDAEAPPLPPPPSSSALSNCFVDDGFPSKTASQDHLNQQINIQNYSAEQLPSLPRPLSYGSNFSSDSVTTSGSTNNDSVSNKSSDSHNCKTYHYNFHVHNHGHSNSFSGSLPQVSAHQRSSSQTCIKVHSEDGSTKVIAIDRNLTVHELCCILIKKYRHPISKAWSIVEQWSDICMERLLEGHLKVVDEMRKWPPNSENKLWFVYISKKFDLFRDVQISESIMTDSYIPSCEGTLYLKSLGKKSWKKLNFVLRSSGLYFSNKGKANKSSDLTCLSNLLDADIFTSLPDWDKDIKAPTRFGFALKPTSSSKLNAQNPIKYLCATDAKNLEKWINALRLVKYGNLLHEDHKCQIVLPSAAHPQQHHVAASWSNLIEDELDRVATNHRLQISSMSLKDCSKLNTSLDSTCQSERRSDSIHSDDKFTPLKSSSVMSSSLQGSRTSIDHSSPSLDSRMPQFNMDRNYEQRLSNMNIKCPLHKPNIPLTFNVSNIISMRQSEEIVGTLPRNILRQSRLDEIPDTNSSSTSFDSSSLLRSRDDSCIKVSSQNGDDPLYDYITDPPLGKPGMKGAEENGYQRLYNTSQFTGSDIHPAFQNIPFIKHPPNQPLTPNSIIPGTLTKSLSQDILEDYRKEHLKQLAGPYESTPYRNSLPRKSLMLQETAANGGLGKRQTAARTDNLELNNKFDFPPPPTPEIFQFLAQNKNDFLPSKHHHYEVPVIHHPHTFHDFYRQSSLNRSFIKDSIPPESFHRAVGNSYTPEPTEFSRYSALNHSFHSSELTKTSKHIIPVPLPPLRSSGTKLSSFRTPNPLTSNNINNMNKSYCSSRPYDERSHYRTHNAIRLLNRMVENKMKIGADGMSDPGSYHNQRMTNSFDSDFDDLPPPPKELLESLKVLRSQNKPHILTCNS